MEIKRGGVQVACAVANDSRPQTEKVMEDNANSLDLTAPTTQ